MSTQYRDYGYSVPEPGAQATNGPLAALFVELVAGLDGVETVCDLGCGSGYLAAHLGTRGSRVTGIDASSTGIEVATRHHATARVSFLRAELGAELVRDHALEQAFDVVVSSDVIEHLYRPDALFETAACLLKPGGHLLVGTPYHGYLKNLAISLVGGWDAHHGVAWDGGHIKFFSVKTLTAAVTRHGFVEPHFHYYGRLPWLWKNMICHARKAQASC